MTLVPAAIPPRIWVVGPPGSGKSTVAKALGARLSVPPVHLDEWFWSPGWVKTPTEDFVARVDAWTATPRWVVDGNYGAIDREYFQRADLVVWLDLPLTVTFPRLLVRTARRVFLGETCCNGNRERLRAVLTPNDDSILWYAARTDGPRRRRYAADLPARPHVRLRHPAAVRRWLDVVAR